MEEKKVGRPSKYKEEYNEIAHDLCLLGYTDKELADHFDVTEKTINNWKKEYPEFLQSVKGGKVFADVKVVKSFHKRATGYKYKEKTYEKKGDKLQVTKIIIKEVVPDSGAGLNWLKNRQPDKWRDKQEIDHTIKGSMNFEIEVPSLDDSSFKEKWEDAGDKNKDT